MVALRWLTTWGLLVGDAATEPRRCERRGEQVWAFAGQLVESGDGKVVHELYRLHERHAEDLHGLRRVPPRYLAHVGEDFPLDGSHRVLQPGFRDEGPQYALTVRALFVEADAC